MILIVGGAGYIGSQVNKELHKQGYETLVLDDLSSGRADLVKWGKLIVGSLGDEKILREIFTNNKIETVMHFAAFKAVGESVLEPQKYYLNNVVNTLTLLKVMREFNINQFVFSSSAAVYGAAQYTPIDEKHPCSPLNPYGWNKLMVEQVLSDYSTAYDFKSVCFRYFNAVGADPESDTGELPGSSANLLPILMDAAIGRRPNVKMFGSDYSTTDGTCIRDYIHVCDLAEAHIKAVEYLGNGGKTDIFNLGNGKGYSVLEMINTAKEITGVDFSVISEGRRAGDSAVLIADSTKAKTVLGWVPKYTDLKVIVDTAWKWNLKLGK